MNVELVAHVILNHSVKFRTNKHNYACIQTIWGIFVGMWEVIFEFLNMLSKKSEQICGGMSILATNILQHNIINQSKSRQYISMQIYFMLLKRAQFCSNLINSS